MLLHDLRYAIRTLRGSPGFTASAVLCMALGIGASTAIFSVAHAVLLRPLEVEEPDRLVRIWETNIPRNQQRNVVGPFNFLRWQDRATSFEQMEVVMQRQFTITGGGDPEQIRAGLTTPTFFGTLGVAPIRGRAYGPDDVGEGVEDRVLLGHGYWQRRFGGDSDIVGKTLTLNGSPVTIIGVVGSEFRFPEAMDLWAPIELSDRYRESRGRWVETIARLSPGVALAQAQAELETIAAQLVRETPDFNTGWSVDVVPLHDDLVGSFRTPILVLLGAVGFVLLIACANVANLMLAHGARRQRELAIRAALGAGRAQVIRQVLTESIVLSLFAGGVSLLVAVWSIEILTRMGRGFLPRVELIGLNFAVLAFALAVSVATGLMFGLIPAMSAARHNLIDGLKGSARVRGALRPRGAWGRNGLIVVQVALSLVLLVGAGLLINSFRRLTSVNPGFDAANLLTMQVDLPGSKYDSDEKQVQFFDEALKRIAALPQVDDAAAISWLPIGSRGSATSFWALDRPKPRDGELPVADVRAVTPGFFRTMNIRLLSGRDFTDADRADASPLAVVVNRVAVERLWPGEDPLGKRILMPWGGDLVAEVIGVVDDVRLRDLDTDSRVTLYWVHRQFAYDTMSLMIRTTGDPTLPAAAVRAQIHALDPDQPVAHVQTMDGVLGEAISRERFLVMLLSVFSGVALVLALIGLYGVIAYVTNRRTREFGIRMALGARPRDLLSSVLGQGLRLALVGAAAGIAAAVALTRLMAGLLFEISPTDPTTFAAVVLLLCAALLAACYLPARRATRINPVSALRCE